EINDLPGFGFFPCQLLFDLTPELVFWQHASSVQPGCTVEALPIPPPRQLGQFQPLRPAHLLQLASDLLRQMLVNRHQVVGLPSRFRKPPLKELIKRDRKSTRLNSSHVSISYAVFCLKKKINSRKPNDAVFPRLKR